MQQNRLRLRRRRIRCAIRRMRDIERDIFLAVRLGDMGYDAIAAKFGISVAEAERHFAASLSTLMQAMEERDPWWWRFWPW